MTTKIAAFFDMDLTLLAVNSAHLWVQHLWREGELAKRDLVRSAGYLLAYKLALVDVTKLSEDAAVRIAGMHEGELEARVRQWYGEAVRPHLIPAMRRRVEAHQEAGHRTALLTTATPYLARPVAEELGFDVLLCTRLETDRAGRFTGRVVAPVCFGEGKVVLSRAWAEEQGVDLAQSYFYSDSYTDRPMLERVGHPVAVNPDPRLALFARRRGIPIERYL